MDCRDKIYQVTGGFIKGMCHPVREVEALIGAGIEWTRMDIPFPINPDGSLTEAFLGYKKECEMYAANGMHMIAISNYGREFIEHGIDVRTPEGLARAQDVCRLAAAELGDLCPIWQISNEVNYATMREPLTSAEGRDFIIASTKGVRAGNPRAIVGHNSYSEEWLEECLEIERQTGGSDYIGYDLYDCTWGDGPYTNYAEKIEKLYQTLGLPVILMEFGFSSSGRMVNAARGDIDNWFRERGIDGLEAGMKDMDAFFGVLTKPDLISKAKGIDRKDPKQVVVNYYQHEAEVWLAYSEFPHTEEGQYDFYDHLLPALMNHPHLAGAVLYSMRDDTKCYYCGSPTCCCEISWGLLRSDGTPKKAYAAVQKYFKK